MDALKYLAGYPEPLLAQVRALIDADRLGPMLAERYAERHAVRNDGQLYDYVQTMKDRYLRKSVPLCKVVYDGKLPAEFLKMIVVHELAHLKETEHNKAFYQLCTHMAPDYHQLEFDLRLYLTQLEHEAR